MLRSIIISFCALCCFSVCPAFAQDIWEEVPLSLSDYIVGTPVAKNDTLFVYTQQSGLFRSLDFGRTWQKTTLDSNLESQNNIVTTPSTIFFPSTNTVSDLGSRLESILYRSTDGGNNWKNVLRFPGFILSIFAVGQHIMVNNYDYSNPSPSPSLKPVLTEWRSRDNGGIWTQKRTDTLFVPLLFDRNTLYAQNANALYTSQDTGQTWKTIRRDSDSTMQIFSLIRKDSILLASLYSVNKFVVINRGLIRLAGNSSIWESISMGNSNLGVTSLIVHRNSIFALNENALMQSLDNGISWRKINVPSSGELVSIISVANTCLILKSSNNTLWHSFDDGGTWQQINKGLANQRVERIVTANDSVYIAAQKMGLLVMRDTSNTYTLAEPFYNTPSGQYASTRLLSSNGTTIHFYFCIKVVSEGRVTAFLREIEPPLSPTTLGWFCFDDKNPISIARYGTRLYMMISGQPLRRWEFTNQLWRDMFLSESDVRLTNLDSTKERYTSLAMSAATILLGTEKGVYRTDDTTSTWRASGLAGQKVFILATMGTLTFAGTNNGIFRSSDTGRTWQASGLQGDTVLYFAIRDTRTILAGTQLNGVFASGDRGQSWQSLSANLPSRSIQSLGLTRQGIGFALTPAGLFRTKRAITTSVKNDALRSTEIVHIQPHPVMETAEVSYTLREASTVDVELWDMLGRQVLTFSQGYQARGEQRFTLSTVELPNGLYFLRLRTSQGIIARPMMIVR